MMKNFENMTKEELQEVRDILWAENEKLAGMYHNIRFDGAENRTPEKLSKWAGWHLTNSRFHMVNDTLKQINTEEKASEL